VRSGGNAPTRFWFWQRGRFTELTGLNEPIMNARGQVAATILDAGGRQHPVIWTDGRLRDGGAFTDDIHVTDINQRGDVLVANPYRERLEGETESTRRSYLWRAGSHRPTDLGNAGGRGLYAHSLNNHRQILAHDDTPGDPPRPRMFLLQDGQLTQLPGATDGWDVSVGFLNDRGDALGARYNSDYLVRSMLWRIR
jgi:hypothetical protein